MTQDMPAPHRDPALLQLSALCADQLPYMFARRSECPLRIARDDLAVDIEIVSAHRDMPRRVISMVQVGPGWQITLELHPIEPIDLSLVIGCNERMQLTARYSIGRRLRCPATSVLCPLISARCPRLRSGACSA